MQKNIFLLLENFKNIESAQLCIPQWRLGEIFGLLHPMASSRPAVGSSVCSCTASYNSSTLSVCVCVCVCRRLLKVKSTNENQKL